MSERRLDRAGVTVRLIGGGLLVRSGDRCWVIDPTPAGVEDLTAAEVRQIGGIVLTEEARALYIRGTFSKPRCRPSLSIPPPCIEYQLARDCREVSRTTRPQTAGTARL